MRKPNELPATLRDALTLAKEVLSSNAELLKKGVVMPEAEQIVLSALRSVKGTAFSRVELYVNDLVAITADVSRRVLYLAEERARGKLLQHLTGAQAFLDHEYDVGPDVLVPRPETEVLVTLAIGKLSQASEPPLLGLELGIGSGIISIELLSRYPKLRMLASELAEGAQQRARRNADRILEAERKDPARLKILAVEDRLSVWEPFEEMLLGQKADFLISNPPYLLDQDEVDREVLLEEPQAALFAPPEDPLYFYSRIAEGASRHLRAGGFVFLEIPHQRSAKIKELFSPEQWDTQIYPDLNQRDRVLVAQWTK